MSIGAPCQRMSKQSKCTIWKEHLSGRRNTSRSRHAMPRQEERALLALEDRVWSKKRAIIYPGSTSSTFQIGYWIMGDFPAGKKNNAGDMMHVQGIQRKSWIWNTRRRRGSMNRFSDIAVQLSRLMEYQKTRSKNLLTLAFVLADEIYSKISSIFYAGPVALPFPV